MTVPRPSPSTCLVPPRQSRRRQADRGGTARSNGARGPTRAASVMSAIVCAIALLTTPARALAAEIEDVDFPDRVEAGDTTLPLFGLGLLRYKILFRGYVGGLYLPPGTPASRTLEDVPKALELYYFWDIDAPLFGEAANELLAKTHPPERIAALRGRLDRLHALYRDVEVGDRYRLTYVPGEGTSLRHNGELLGTIPGADFAADYFGIWLGEEPINEAFRDQMFARFGVETKP